MSSQSIVLSSGRVRGPLNRVSSAYEVHSPDGHAELEAIESVGQRNRLQTIISSGPGSTSLNQAQEYIAELSAHRSPPLRLDEDLRDQSVDEDPPKVTEKEKICGLRPVVFWIVILLIVMLLAAGIGVGLGMGLATTPVYRYDSQRYESISMPVLLFHLQSYIPL